jgi:hypothetical protein
VFISLSLFPSLLLAGGRWHYIFYKRVLKHRILKKQYEAIECTLSINKLSKADSIINQSPADVDVDRKSALLQRGEAKDSISTLR